MRQCGNNNVPSLLCGKWQEPSFMWKKWDHVHETLQWCRPCEPKNLVSVLVTFFFFQEQGKKASLPGCDLSDIRHCCRPVPSRAEKQNSPCLPWAQCNSQSSRSMSWTEPLEYASQWFLLKEEGGRGEKRTKKVKADGFDFIYISCHVQ